MKKTFTALSAMSMLAIATPAFAHVGDHSGIFASLGHWLSSPSHGLFTVIGLSVLGFAAYKLTRKNTQA